MKMGLGVTQAFVTVSEGPDLSVDDHVGDLVDVVEPLLGDCLGLGLPCVEVGLVLCVGQDDLHGCVEGLGDGLSDLGEQPDPDLCLVGDLVCNIVGDELGHDVVDLSDVGDGVLSGGCLHGHGPVGGDQSVAPVSTSDRSVVSHLLGKSSAGQVVVAKAFYLYESIG